MGSEMCIRDRLKSKEGKIMMIPERIEIIGTNPQTLEKTRERSGGEKGEEVLSLIHI